ncbi:MAG: hypothetical protein JJU15_07400 [Pararhodobacter sp.]|nr:hypothetical protein [Pararhodobacter sp.]
MRGPTRYAGAMFLYGPQTRPPDLTLAMQFLIDDLRFDGRQVGWIALKGNSLRLRLDGFELVLAHTETSLPPQAFNGVLRPLAGAVPSDADEAFAGADLARGRVLHSLRHHPFALSVLLRPRGPSPASDPDEALLDMVRECRALVEPVIEAAPPATVIWQPGAVAFTCEEFLASRAETLILPGDREHPVQLTTDNTRPRHRPTLDAAFQPEAAGDPALLDAPVVPAGAEAPRADGARRLQSRSDRADRRSAGQLFGKDRAAARPVALPRLHRQDARLIHAMRAGPAPEADAAARARKRRLNIARVANITALVVWYSVLLQPFSSWI